jgi:hypothetical protein
MARSKSPPHVRNPFYHPRPDEYDFDRLLETLKNCRVMAKRLTMTCGLRNPIYREAEGLLAQIDAVAALSRISGASEFVNPEETVHTSAFLNNTPNSQSDDG